MVGSRVLLGRLAEDPEALPKDKMAFTCIFIISFILLHFGFIKVLILLNVLHLCLIRCLFLFMNYLFSRSLSGPRGAAHGSPGHTSGRSRRLLLLLLLLPLLRILKQILVTSTSTSSSSSSSTTTNNNHDDNTINNEHKPHNNHNDNTCT